MAGINFLHALEDKRGWDGLCMILLSPLITCASIEIAILLSPTSPSLTSYSPAVPFNPHSRASPCPEQHSSPITYNTTAIHSFRPAPTDNARTQTFPSITVVPPVPFLLAMGKLIKNHWARLIILTAAACMSSISPLLLQFLSSLPTY